MKDEYTLNQTSFIFTANYSYESIKKMVTQFFFDNKTLLDNILISDGDDIVIEQKLIHKISEYFSIFDFKNMDNNYRDLSFGQHNFENRKKSFQQFEFFLSKTKILSQRNRANLCAIATCNWNGYIREKALYELAESNPEFALPFALLRLRDWVPEVKLAAIRCLKTALWNYPITSLINLNHLMIPIFNDKRLHYYFFSKYVPRQTQDELLESLRKLDDNAFAYDLWIWIFRKHLGTPALFELAQTSKHQHVRYLAFSYIPLIKVDQYKSILKKLPNYYAIYFVNWLKHNPDKVKNSHFLKKTLEDYLFKNNAALRKDAADLLKQIFQISDKDIAEIYRNTLAEGKITPGIIRGLGENGNALDIERFTSYSHHSKEKIRKAASFALLCIKYKKT